MSTVEPLVYEALSKFPSKGYEGGAHSSNWGKVLGVEHFSVSVEYKHVFWNDPVP